MYLRRCQLIAYWVSVISLRSDSIQMVLERVLYAIMWQRWEIRPRNKVLRILLGRTQTLALIR